MKKFLIAGLGNPGARYSKTRHNAGFDFIAELKKKWKVEFDEIKSIKSHLSTFMLDDTKVYIQIPNVFMNNSGNAIQPAVKRYNINLNKILIIHDDLDLPSGLCKLKNFGGDGGHNGLKSIIEKLGGRKDFLRMRIGIGHPGDSKLVNNYVVKKGTKKEMLERKRAIEGGLEVLEDIILNKWELALNKLHSK